MKIFISQAMRGRTDKEILEERQKAMEIIDGIYPDSEFIDSFIKDAPETAKPLYCLGVSLTMLSEADMCFFVNDCMMGNRGCLMEYNACITYDIPFGNVFTDTNTATIEMR